MIELMGHIRRLLMKEAPVVGKTPNVLSRPTPRSALS
jgi:hypothetical protein